MLKALRRGRHRHVALAKLNHGEPGVLELLRSVAGSVAVVSDGLDVVLFCQLRDMTDHVAPIDGVAGHQLDMASLSP